MAEPTVDELMTAPLLTVDADDAVASIASAMTEAGVNSVVVVDDACAPVGIVTSTDYVRLTADAVDLTETTVGSVMTRDIVTTRPETPVRDAAASMTEHALSHLPVVDDDGEAIGLVSTTDLAAYLAGETDT